MRPLRLHLLAYFEPLIIPCWLGISTVYITSLSITYYNLKSACSPTYGRDGSVSRPLLIFQISTNNWQRQGEFAPGSGILHASFHQTMNSISTSRLPREFQRRQNSCRTSALFGSPGGCGFFIGRDDEFWWNTQQRHPQMLDMCLWNVMMHLQSM